jgi:hypothetical protein
MMAESKHYGGIVSEERAAPRAPSAPGASRSPQRPGQTPDRGRVAGHVLGQAPRVAGVPRRPLTQYGTAQEMSYLLPAPTEEADPADFEQPQSSFQERRKAFIWQLPPTRPTSFFSLDQGVSETPPELPSGEVESLAETVDTEG